MSGNDLGFVMATTGGDGFDGQVRDFVTNNYQLVFAALVIMAIVIVYLVTVRCVEKFNPGQTLRVGQRDDQGATNYVQNSGVGIIASEQAILAPKPGTIPYKILHDPSFNCAGRTAAGDNAWAWMSGVAAEKEGMLAGAPIDENALSALAQGYGRKPQ